MVEMRKVIHHTDKRLKNNCSKIWISGCDKPKKQPVCRQGRHYIYVARDKSYYAKYVLYHKKMEFVVDKNTKDIFFNGFYDEEIQSFILAFLKLNNTKLEVGQQVRIPILVDNAEVVR